MKRAIGAVGSASERHSEGHWFESSIAHLFFWESCKISEYKKDLPSEFQSFVNTQLEILLSVFSFGEGANKKRTDFY